MLILLNIAPQHSNHLLDKGRTFAVASFAGDIEQPFSVVAEVDDSMHAHSMDRVVVPPELLLLLLETPSPGDNRLAFKGKISPNLEVSFHGTPPDERWVTDPLNTGISGWNLFLLLQSIFEQIRDKLFPLGIFFLAGFDLEVLVVIAGVVGPEPGHLFIQPEPLHAAVGQDQVENCEQA